MRCTGARMRCCRTRSPTARITLRSDGTGCLLWRLLAWLWIGLASGSKVWLTGLVCMQQRAAPACSVQQQHAPACNSSLQPSSSLHSAALLLGRNTKPHALPPRLHTVGPQRCGLRARAVHEQSRLIEAASPDASSTQLTFQSHSSLLPVPVCVAHLRHTHTHHDGSYVVAHGFSRVRDTTPHQRVQNTPTLLTNPHLFLHSSPLSPQYALLLLLRVGLGWLGVGWERAFG